MQSNVTIVRGKVVSAFAQTLGDDDVAKNLELVLYNAVLRQCVADKMPLVWDAIRERYTAKAVGINVFHLKKSEALRRKLVSGALPLKTFIAMKPWEVFPDLWADAFERAAKKQLGRDVGFMTRQQVDAMPDGALTCSRCKSKKTTYIEMQTRAADEPMTVFASCMNCGKRWKS